MTRYHLLLTVLAVAIVVMAMSLVPRQVRIAETDGPSAVPVSQFVSVLPPILAEAPSLRDVPAAPLPSLLDDGGGVDSALQVGTASWYRDPRKTGLYAAVPSYRFGDAPYKVRVCRTGSGRCVTVTVSDACGCPGRRIVDLSPDSFQRLAALSVGLVAVTVAVTVAYPDGPLPTPPPTDSDGR